MKALSARDHELFNKTAKLPPTPGRHAQHLVKKGQSLGQMQPWLSLRTFTGSLLKTSKGTGWEQVVKGGKQVPYPIGIADDREL